MATDDEKPAAEAKPGRARPRGHRRETARKANVEPPRHYSSDPVELASDLSFPASDPPAWIGSGR